jgi:hypothetical protein
MFITPSTKVIENRSALLLLQTCHNFFSPFLHVIEFFKMGPRQVHTYSVMDTFLEVKDFMKKIE